MKFTVPDKLPNSSSSGPVESFSQPSRIKADTSRTATTVEYLFMISLLLVME
jgi:hypothetical protein